MKLQTIVLLLLLGIGTLVSAAAEFDDDFDDDLPIPLPKGPKPNRVKGDRLRKREPEVPGGRNLKSNMSNKKSKKGKKKRLYQVETGTCLDFVGNNSQGHLVDCQSTNTKLKEENVRGSSTLKRFKIYHKDGKTKLPQNGEYLDAVVAGAYPFDGSSEQMWRKIDLGGGTFKLQDQKNFLYLDDSDEPVNKIEVDFFKNDPCQTWMFI